MIVLEKLHTAKRIITELFITVKTSNNKKSRRRYLVIYFFIFPLN